MSGCITFVMAFLRIRPGRSSWMEKSDMGKRCWYRQNSLSQNLDLNIRLVSVVSYHLPFICWCFEGAQNWKIGQKWFCNALRDSVPLYNVKNIKNINRGVLLLVSSRLKPAVLLRVILIHGCHVHILNCTNSAKSR